MLNFFVFGWCVVLGEIGEAVQLVESRHHVYGYRVVAVGCALDVGLAEIEGACVGNGDEASADWWGDVKYLFSSEMVVSLPELSSIHLWSVVRVSCSLLNMSSWTYLLSSRNKYRLRGTWIPSVPGTLCINEGSHTFRYRWGFILCFHMS